MKKLLTILSFLLCSHAFAQSDSVYYFKEVGMTTIAPEGFKKVTEEEDRKIQARGEKAIEEANDIDVDASTTRTLLSIRKGAYNYLSITIMPYKETEKNGWLKENETVKEMLYQSFAGKVQPGHIDTTSSVVKIDGLKFEKFLITVKLPGNALLRMVLLSKFHRGYDFGISYVYLTEENGLLLERMVYGSKFKN